MQESPFEIGLNLLKNEGQQLKAKSHKTKKLFTAREKNQWSEDRAAPSKGW